MSARKALMWREPPFGEYECESCGGRGKADAEEICQGSFKRGMEELAAVNWLTDLGRWEVIG